MKNLLRKRRFDAEPVTSLARASSLRRHAATQACEPAAAVARAARTAAGVVAIVVAAAAALALL